MTPKPWLCLVQFSRSVVSESFWSHGPHQCQAFLSITNSCSLLKLMSIKSEMPSNHLIIYRPFLFPPSVIPSIFPRVFSSKLVHCISWPKFWSFTFNISPFNEHSGLISFRTAWLDLLAVQGTLKSLFQQFNSINSSELRFIYSPALTSIHDYWKNHSFDCTDIYWQINVSAF